MDGTAAVRIRRGSPVDRSLPISKVSAARSSPCVYPDRLTRLLLRFEVPHDCSVELSPLGYKFFTDIFEAYDKDQDGALKTEELNDLFSTSPGNPWANQKFPDATVADDTGAVTLQGWLAQWRYGAPRFILLRPLYDLFPHTV